MTGPPAPGAAGRRPIAALRAVRRSAWTVAIVGLLGALLAVEKLVHPTLNVFDMQSLVDGALPLCLAAMAQTAVVLSGGIDLSVGPMMSLVNVVSALLMTHATNGQAVLIALGLMAVAAAAGALTGAVIVATGVPDIIVTLATGFVWGGLALHIMPIPGGAAPAGFAALMTGELGSVPSGLVVILAALAILWEPVHRSPAGLALYAVGSNRAAAYLSGVAVGRARVTAYAMGGAFAALGGFALTASTTNGNAAAGTSYTLTSVAATVLGGVSLAGGRGGMIGPVAAALLLTLINTLLTFEGVDPNFSLVVQGAIVVLVVMVAGLVLVRRRGA